MAEKVRSQTTVNEIHLAEDRDLGVFKDEEEPEASYTVGVKTWFAVFALGMANVCTVMTNTTNTTIKWQVATVRGDPALASWIANGNYLLTLAFGPVFGLLSDRLGKKWFIIGGCVLGILGSCTSASAHTIAQIIGGNITTGIANAGCIVSISANQEVITNKQRPIAMGINQTMAMCFAIIGTFTAASTVGYNVGGQGGWQWAYWINAMVYGLSGILVFLAYCPPPPMLRRQGELKQILFRVDYGGCFLLCGSLASLIYGLTVGGTRHPWGSTQVIVALVCGCLGLILLGLYEWLVKKDGLFDHRLMQTANFMIIIFVCMVDGMLLLAVNVVYAQEIADLFTKNTVKIALVLLSHLLTSSLGCFPVGWLMAKTKSYRVLLVGALLWCAVFIGLLSLLNQHRLAMACIFSALFGLGTAVVTVVPVAALALSVPSFLLGTATTIGISARPLGGIIGVTIFTAIFDNKFSHNLAADVKVIMTAQGYHDTGLLEQVLHAASSPNPRGLHMLGLPQSLITAIQIAAVQARSTSWTFVWVGFACVVAASALGACFLKPVSRRMNTHIESALEPSEIRDRQLRHY